MQIEKKDIKDLLPAEYNPRHDLQPGDKEYEKLKKSIQEFDYVDPVIWNEQTGVVVGGHQRLKVLKDLGHTEVEVSVVDLPLEKEMALNVALNKVSGDWDTSKLSDLMLDLQDMDIDMELTGFDMDEINDLLPDKVEDGLCDEDQVPDVPEEPITKLGDIYQLGDHRLMCGDSTSIDAVDKLMGGEKAEITFTSPPYNAGATPTETKSGKTSKYNDYDDNLSESDYTKFLCDYLNTSLVVSDYSFCNIQSLSGNKIALIDLLYEMKGVYADSIIWDKLNSQPAMAENVLNSEFEYVHIFSNKGNRSVGCKQFRGTIPNILHLSKQTKNKVKEHNATFSIEFASFFVDNFSNKGGSIFDPFGGSGTTAIACETLGRKSFLMELDPKYCDVIVKRWEDYTGKKAELLNG